MNNQLASKQKNSPWLPLLLGSLGALLAIGACSVDKSKYSFIPDDEFNSTTNAGNGGGANPNGGGANPNGGDANPNGGDSGAVNADAGAGNTGATGARECVASETTTARRTATCKPAEPEPRRPSTTASIAAIRVAVTQRRAPASNARQASSSARTPRSSSATSSAVPSKTRKFAIARRTAWRPGKKVTACAASPAARAASSLTRRQPSSPTMVTRPIAWSRATWTAREPTPRRCVKQTPRSAMCRAKPARAARRTPFSATATNPRICNADGSNWDSIKKATCTSPSLCDPVGGACMTTGQCTPGQFQCDRTTATFRAVVATATGRPSTAAAARRCATLHRVTRVDAVNSVRPTGARRATATTSKPALTTTASTFPTPTKPAPPAHARPTGATLLAAHVSWARSSATTTAPAIRSASLAISTTTTSRARPARCVTRPP